MIRTDLITKFVKKETPVHFALFGGVKNQPALAEEFSRQACDFLYEFKGKTISTKQIIDFFHNYFPLLKISVADKTKDVFGNKKSKFTNTSLAAVIAQHDRKKRITKNILLELSSSSKKSRNGHFLVDSEFANTFTHEATHIIQLCTKPTAAAYENSIKRHSKNNDKICNLLEKEVEKIYRKYAYHEELLPISGKSFAKKIINGLKKTIYPKKAVMLPPINGKKEKVIIDAQSYLSDNGWKTIKPNTGMQRFAEMYAEKPFEITPRILIDQIKIILRSMQEEKQAYEIGTKQYYMFKYRKLGKLKPVEKLFGKLAQIETSVSFKFDTKIKALQNAYLSLVEQVRNGIQ